MKLFTILIVSAVLMQGCSVSNKPASKGDINESGYFNFLLIVADDMGLQMGAVNTLDVYTPTLDKLAEGGRLFTRAYATFSSCSPSRASFLTSTFPHVNGLTRNVFEFIGANPPRSLRTKGDSLNIYFAVKDHIVTLVEALSKAGYYTGITGKFHMSPHYKFPFDYWGKSVDAEVFFRKAKRSGKPFFLDYNLHTPHRPFVRSPYKRIKRDLNKLSIPRYLPDNKLMHYDWESYLEAIEATDAGIDHVLALLEKNGMRKNTIVVFISDHGPSFHRSKYSVYPFGSHIPMIFAGPTIKKNVQSDALVSLIDLMPTILDFADVENPSTVEGVSLKGLLTGKNSKPVHDYVFTEVSMPLRGGWTGFEARAMTDGRFWYIRRNDMPRVDRVPADNYEISKWKNYSYKATLGGKDDYPLQYHLLEVLENGLSKEQLFDLYSDPWSMHDISKNYRYSIVLNRMRKKMDEWIMQTNDEKMKKTIE